MTQPRHDLDAERAVLGAMMIDAAAIETACGLLNAADFYQARHAAVFAAIVAAHADGEPTEPIAVARRLDRDGDLGKVGGAPALLEMVQAVPLAANVGWYAQAVRDLAMLRGLQTVSMRGQDIAARADDPHAAIDRVRADLDALDGSSHGDLKRLGDYADDALEAIERAGRVDGGGDVLPTGLHDLDRILGGGLRGGQVVVIAGRPGMGKSVLARTLIRHAVFTWKTPTALFTMEMSPIEVFHCVLSAETSTPLASITSGQLSDDEWTRAARWVGEWAGAPLYLDDTPGIGLAEVRAKASRLRRTDDLGLLVVDYLQLMSSPSSRSENRQQEVTALSRGFKHLAVELGIPIVLVAQLNRSPEMRADKRPQLSDLRESGSIEQDANVVIMVHRDEYYDKESPRLGEADLIVAKNRGGPQGVATVASQLHLSRFSSMAVRP